MIGENVNPFSAETPAFVETTSVIYIASFTNASRPLRVVDDRPPAHRIEQLMLESVKWNRIVYICRFGWHNTSCVVFPHSICAVSSLIENVLKTSIVVPCLHE